MTSATRNHGVHKGARRLGALAAAVLLVALLLPGCWGKTELEERSFVTLLGIDRSASGNILVTTVIAVPRSVGGAGRMGGGSSTPSVMLTGEGRDIREAMRKIEVLNSRQLSTVHLAFVVVSEEFARSDIGPIIDIFSRSLEFRHNALIVVSRERAIDLLKGFQTLEEVEPSLYLTKLVETSSSETGACPVVTMHEFMIGYNTISTEPWAPYVGLASAAPAEKPAAEGSQKTGSSGGGGQGQATGEPANLIGLFGTALFSKVGAVQKMVGYLDTEQSMAALVMDGTLATGFFDIPYPGDQSETTLAISHVDSSRRVTLDNGSVQASFRVVATAALEESQVGAELPEKASSFRETAVHTAEDALLTLLQSTFTKLTSNDSDVIGLGRDAQGAFPDYPAWEAFDWKTKFKDAVATFDIKVHILSSGFTIEKPFPR